MPTNFMTWQRRMAALAALFAAHLPMPASAATADQETRFPPKIAVMPATPAGPPGIEDKQKIEGWDASELRDGNGAITTCFIRRHYSAGAETPARHLAIFLVVTRAKGLIMMLKDSRLSLPEGQPIEASLQIGDAPFSDFSAQVEGSDEIAFFPRHGAALAAAIEKDSALLMRAKEVQDHYGFSVQPGVIGWLRACARRNEMAIEPTGP